MMRSLAFALVAVLFSGCANAGHVLPDSMPGVSNGTAGASTAATPDRHAGRRVAVRMRVRIPHRRSGGRERHPATISPLTRSIGVSIDGGAQQTFNTTPTSPGCVIGADGTICTVSVQAKPGTDTFVVTTYANTGATGIALDRGIATVPIVTGEPNAVALSLGPLVSSAANAGVGSLRYAIGSANAGDTILFVLPAGSTIALTSPIAIAGNVTIAGPGSANPVTISGGNAHQIFSVTGKATISGLTITQGKAAVPNAPGGAIANTGTLTLANDTIGNSTSTVSLKRAPRKRHNDPFSRRHPNCATTTAYGGALYNDGTVAISGTTFTGNVVQSDIASCLNGYGGAIYNDFEGTLSSTGDTFTNNSALEGGAVYNAGFGATTFTNDSFSANTGCTAASGCPTSGCTTMSCTSYAQGEGAAIFDAGIGVTINSSTFSNNIAGGVSSASQGEGGALALTSGGPTVTGSTFTGNLAGGGTAVCSTGEGGAIAASVPVVLDGDTFTDNRAVGDATSGGGAVADSMDVQAANDTFTSNAAVGSGSACSSSAVGAGGAIYGQASVRVTSSTFKSNAVVGASTGGGGAVACYGCYITGNTFTSNSALGTGTGATSGTGGGGAVLVQTVGKIIGNTFTSNSARVEGTNATGAFGGAIAASTGTLVTSANTFTSNSATETDPIATVAGGAEAVVGASYISTNDTFKSNVVSGGTTAAGGAAYIDGGYVVSGAIVTGNRVAGVQAVGGGLSVGETGELSNATFTSNSATATSGMGAGGAVYDSAGSAVSGVTFSKNTATGDGGAIYADGSEIISGSTVSGNAVTKAATASSGGGGIFAGGTLNISTSTVSNNSVTISGAGSSGGGGIFNGGGLTVGSSTIASNAVLGSATASGGGGIYSNATATLENATITGNSSARDGGGVFIASNDAVTVTNVTLFKNVASGSGGNLLNLFAMTLTNSVVGGGGASVGPDIDNTGTLTSGDYNIIQTAVAGTALAGTTTHNKTADPLLLALANNGGSTFTNADQALSPGHAYIPFSGTNCGTESVPLDQRGYARGAGGKCDAGAFEYGGLPSAARHHQGPRRSAAATGHGGAHLRPFHIVAPRLILMGQTL